MRPSLWAIVIMVLVIVLLFGARRLPDVVTSVGKSMKIFKKEVKDLTSDVADTGHSASGYPPPTPVSDDLRPTTGVGEERRGT